VSCSRVISIHGCSSWYQWGCALMGRGQAWYTAIFIIYIYLFLILTCNCKVMAEAIYSNYKVGSLAITPGPHRDTPRSGHSVRRYSPPLLSLCIFHLASSVPGALLAWRPPCRVVLHFLLPSPPIFSSFSHLCFLHGSYQYIRE
jgi:hypothetical protein